MLNLKKFRIKFYLNTILFFIFSINCISWSTNYPKSEAVQKQNYSDKINSIFVSYSSSSLYQNVIEKTEEAIYNKIKKTGKFLNVEKKQLLSNQDRADFFLEVKNQLIPNNSLFNFVLYINCFISGLTFTAYPVYWPTAEEFEMTLYKYDYKKSTYQKISNKKYDPTQHYVIGISTIPFLWINYFTNNSYELIEYLVEDSLNHPELNKKDLK